MSTSLTAADDFGPFSSIQFTPVRTRLATRPAIHSTLGGIDSDEAFQAELVHRLKNFPRSCPKQW
jgi:hypothetical protein